MEDEIPTARTHGSICRFPGSHGRSLPSSISQPGFGIGQHVLALTRTDKRTRGRPTAATAEMIGGGHPADWRRRFATLIDSQVIGGARSTSTVFPHSRHAVRTSTCRHENEASSSSPSIFSLYINPRLKNQLMNNDETPPLSLSLSLVIYLW